MTDANRTNDAPRPSAKAQGKRPANGTSSASTPVLKHESVTPAPSLSTTSAPSKAGVQTRQKRVLPTRSRRGGPGVGSCEVDVMILETRKRRLESEPLIPTDTKFLLTTNSALVPPGDSVATLQLQVNVQAYGRYFDRPEVQAACRQQQAIQTPEFTLLPEEAIVGGRFRPRGSEEEMVDTSDAAYEKRHRKYETFEKRQRLREKEKLKHEQYKLNERIEQLRGMDTSAFLSLPASMFSEPPGVIIHEGEPDEVDVGLSDLPGAHVNGAAAHNEGERRRQEMLDVAESLAERYRVLLPPDRKWAEKKEAERREKALRESAEASAEPEIETIEKRSGRGHAKLVPESSSAEEEEEEEEEEEDQLVSDEEEEVPPARPGRGRPHDSDGESEVDFEERERERSKGLKLRIKFPPGLVIRKRSEETPSPPSKKKHKKRKSEDRASSSAGPSPKGKVRVPEARFQHKPKRQTALDEYDILPPSKKYKASASTSTSVSKPTPTKPHPGPSTKVECALLKAAERNTAAPSARKTQRHVTAFGVPVPEEISQIRDFMVPVWCWPRISEDEESEIETGDHWNGSFNGHDLGFSATPEYGHWDENDEDTKEEFPEIATLDDD